MRVEPPSCRALTAGVLAAFLLASGCASTTYDPVAPTNEPLRVVRVSSPLGLEGSYRRLFARLEHCLSASGYHVQPRFDRHAGHAYVMVVSGLGFDRYSFIGNRFAARFDIREQRTGALIEITQRDAELTSVVNASEAWLVRDDAGCNG